MMHGSLSELQEGETAAARAPVSSARREVGFVLRRMLVAGDALALLTAVTVASTVVDPSRTSFARLAAGALVIAPAVILFKLYGLYERDTKRVSHSTLDDVPHVFHALLLSVLALWLVLKIAVPEQRLIFVEGLAFLAVAFVAVLAIRGLVRRVATAAASPERVLLLGGGPMTAVLVRKLRAHREYALHPIGYIDAAPRDDTGRFPLAYLGSIEELDLVCVTHGVQRVLAVSGALEHEALADVVRRMRAQKVRVSLVPDLVDVLGPAVEIDEIEGITVLGINPPVLTRSSRVLKRTMDVVVASVALVALLPLLVLAALAVRLESPGAALYSQERVGRDGRHFRICKLRTMVADADQRAWELERESRHPAWLLLDDDPRITRVGHRLRRASIDEVPQLWNVLRGDMSLVGPRPMLPAVNDQIEGGSSKRLDLTPGLTGLWQVLGRTAIPFEEMVKLDYLYAANWSLWTDVRLLIRTLPAIIDGRGAN